MIAIGIISIMVIKITLDANNTTTTLKNEVEFDFFSKNYFQKFVDLNLLSFETSNSYVEIFRLAKIGGRKQLPERRSKVYSINFAEPILTNEQETSSAIVDYRSEMWQFFDYNSGNDRKKANTWFYSIIVKSGFGNYKNVKYPLKAFHLLDFSKMKQLKGLNQEVRTCFFDMGIKDWNSSVDDGKIDGISESIGLKFAEDYHGLIVEFFPRDTVNYDANVDNRGEDVVSEIDCEPIIQGFLDLNKDNPLLKKYTNDVMRYKSLQRLVRKKTFVQKDGVEKQIDETLMRLAIVHNNIVEYNYRENELLDTYNERKRVDNYITCWDGQGPECKTTLKNEPVGIESYPNAVKMIFDDDVLFETYENGNKKTLKFGDAKYNQLTNIILAVDKDINDGNQVDKDYVYGSTADSVEKPFEFEKVFPFTLNGFVSLIPYSPSNPADYNLRLVKGSLEIFGVKETSTFEAREPILGTPIYFSNVNFSNFTIGTDNNSFTDSLPYTKYFQFLTPDKYKTEITIGEYKSALIVFFPWFIANKTKNNINGFSYGYYTIIVK